MVQISLFITLVTFGYMVDAIVRILRSVKGNRKHIMDESYMLLHILAFFIYAVNLTVADGFFIKNVSSASITPPETM